MAKDAKTKAIENKKDGHPKSSFKGKHKFVNSASGKEYTGGAYGGMNLEQAMEFETHRKKKK